MVVPGCPTLGLLGSRDDGGSGAPDGRHMAVQPPLANVSRFRAWAGFHPARRPGEHSHAHPHAGADPAIADTAGLRIAHPAAGPLAHSQSDQDAGAGHGCASRPFAFAHSLAGCGDAGAHHAGPDTYRGDPADGDLDASSAAFAHADPITASTAGAHTDSAATFAAGADANGDRASAHPDAGADRRARAHVRADAGAGLGADRHTRALGIQRGPRICPTPAACIVLRRSHGMHPGYGGSSNAGGPKGAVWNGGSGGV
jgi:hypothetical protein